MQKELHQKKEQLQVKVQQPKPQQKLQQKKQGFPKLVFNNKAFCYDPVNSIRILIRTLDADLKSLCKEYNSPRNKKPLSSECEKPKEDTIPVSTLTCFAGRIREPMSTSTSSAPPTQEPSPKPTDLSPMHIKTLASIYRTRVLAAYRERKIFTVYGNYATVRRQLIRRGWVEKLSPNRHSKLQSLPEEILLQHATHGNDYEAVIISKIISHFPSFFIWQPKTLKDIGSEVHPIRNRVRRGRNLDFSTKIGLIGCAEQATWYNENGVAYMSYPRFYRLCVHEDRKAFIEDYQHTATRNLLRYLSERSKSLEYFLAEDGNVAAGVLEFALTDVRRQIDDIDNGYICEGCPQEVTEIMEWDDFLTESYRFMTNRGRFRLGDFDLVNYVKMGKDYLDKLDGTYTEYGWDGTKNLWILKPGYQCRGIGISIKSNLNDILQWSDNNQTRKYIAQKYVERPLLIFKTKFDIRQYMLLTITEKRVNIWMYRDCYLRFSSQEFTMDDLRESVHLTNNSVQKRYRNKSSRDNRLPQKNMWSLDQFRDYLKNQYGTSEMWDKKIYKGFKQSLIAVVLASLEETELTSNCFELYGCDFMLDEKFNPILIEINSTPDLSSSTDVTANICPNALKDLVKVVVDLPSNLRCTTGLFEKVYQISYRLPKYFEPVNEMEVVGVPLSLKIPSVKSGITRAIKKPAKLIKSAIKGPFSKMRARKRAAATAATKSSESESELQAIKNNDDSLGDNESSNSIHLPSVARESLALKYTQPK